MFETLTVFYWSFEHITWRSVYIISTGLDRERGCALLYVVSQTGSFYYSEFSKEVVFHPGGLLRKTVPNHSGHLNQAPQCVWYAENHQNQYNNSPRHHHLHPHLLTFSQDPPRIDCWNCVPRGWSGGQFDSSTKSWAVLLYREQGNGDHNVLRRIWDNCPTRIKQLSEYRYLAHI